MRRALRKKHRDELLPADLTMLYRPPTPAEVIRTITRQNAIDPRLFTTDGHMQRWAVGQGTGLPNPERALRPKTTLPPLPPEVAIITDQIVLTSPRPWQRFVMLWYRSDCSTDQLLERLSISRDKLYIERRLVLAYLLGRFTAVGIRLATFDAEA